MTQETHVFENETENIQTFDLDAVFDSAGSGGSGAPSFEWPTHIDPRNKTRVVPIEGSAIQGEITDVFVTVVKDVDTGKPKVNKKGQQMPQVNVTLKTDLRNWEGAKKIPLNDPQDPSSGEKDPSEDTGERRVYVKYRMLDAVARAIRASEQKSGGPRVGAKLAVKITKLDYDPNPARHPLPDYEAAYVAPAADPAADIFNKVSENPLKQGAAASDPWVGAGSSSAPPF